MAKISRDRAERIARAHACENCGEYSYKKLTVKPAPAAMRDELGEAWHAVKICGVCGMQQELGEAWHAVKICGVCGMQQELGIDDEGEIVYVS